MHQVSYIKQSTILTSIPCKKKRKKRLLQKKEENDRNVEKSQEIRMQWHRISEKNDGNSCPIRGTKENKGDVISFCSGKLRRDISRRKRGDWQSVWQLEYHRSRASGNNFALSLPPFPLIGQS